MGLFTRLVPDAGQRIRWACLLPSFAIGGLWPWAGAPSIDFIATLLTAVPHLQRLLWSRQIEKSYDSCQS